MNDSRDVSYLRSTAQTALLGAVTPALRAVSVDIVGSTLITRFYYDGPISDSDKELASIAVTEMISAFSRTQLDEKIIQLDCPNPIPTEGIRVYHRYEP